MKVLFVVFLFIFFKNFVPKSRANKKNVTMVKITSTYLVLRHLLELQTDQRSYGQK